MNESTHWMRSDLRFFWGKPFTTCKRRTRRDFPYNSRTHFSIIVERSSSNSSLPTNATFASPSCPKQNANSRGILRIDLLNADSQYQPQLRLFDVRNSRRIGNNRRYPLRSNRSPRAQAGKLDARSLRRANTCGVSQVRGPQWPKGGVDKRCTVEMVGQFAPLIASANATNYFIASNRAIGKLKRGVVRALERQLYSRLSAYNAACP